MYDYAADGTNISAYYDKLERKTKSYQLHGTEFN
jgi:hypothetical protein